MTAFTRALSVGNVAIDKIANGCMSGVSADERGGMRANGAGLGGAACDVGAYEYDMLQTTSAVSLRELVAARDLRGWLRGLWRLCSSADRDSRER